jgi:hypothetical protein
MSKPLTRIGTFMRARTVAASLALILSVLSLGACTETPSAPLDDAAGTYTLKTVDGSALPFVYLDLSGWRDEIVSGVVELRVDGNFRDESIYRRTREGVTTMQTVTLTGTWSRRDDLIRFLPTGEVATGRLYTMRFEGTRLTLVEVGRTIVFER